VIDHIVTVQRTLAKEHYTNQLAAAKTAYRSAVELATTSYKAQLAALADIVYAKSLENNKLTSRSTEDVANALFRPPTWVQAVEQALQNGPTEGMTVTELLEAVQAMGLRTKGPKSSKDPLLMVNNTLFRLSRKNPTVRRVGRGKWALKQSP
jgi:hypothetical protein